MSELKQIFELKNILRKILLCLPFKEICKLSLVLKNKSDDENFVWHLKSIQSFTLEKEFELPKSFESWKQFFGCQSGILAGCFTFHSFKRSDGIPAASYSDIKPGLLKNISLGSTALKKPNKAPSVNARSKRYIAAICSDQTNHDHFCLYNNTLYFVDKSSGFQIINYKDLSSSQKPLMKSVAQRRPIALLKCSTTGLLVSLASDGLISVWSLTPTLQKKTDILLEKETFISCLDLYKDKLAILAQDGSISIWNLITGSLLSVFVLPFQFHGNFQRSLKKNITISRGFIGVGISKSGEYLIFARDKFGLYSFQKSLENTVGIHELEGFSSSPATFQIRNNFILTNSLSPDEINLYSISPILNIAKPVNLFWEYVIEAPIKQIQKLVNIEKVASLSETKSLVSYGFHKIEASGDMPNATFDQDLSMVLGVVESDQVQRLVVFDFRVSKLVDRHFEKLLIGDLYIWLCYDQ